MNDPFTRRAFIKTAGKVVTGTVATAGAFSALKWPGLVAAAEADAVTGKSKFRYRAVSWWLTWDDLTWPNAELMDRIRRRADQCLANGVNCCVIFGAHFRWDFLPLWGRLHDELRFIADELHQRKIILFDHHSSVLTHRPRNRDEAVNIWQRNRHHVPFYPSAAESAVREFNGTKIDSWRMRDVETGAPIYLPTYNAEQYCMNNPAFRAAYGKYLEQLKNETAIDGLMSDDGIFYADWRACACEHCRARFKNEHGRDLPPTSDTAFWGNRQSDAFKDWIAMRFKSSGDFLAGVKGAFPSGYPLLTCCSSSEAHYLPAFGMSYQDFIEHCNHVLLEMVGSTPSLAGTWDDRIPSQLLHLGIARDHQAPCFGLGYGFFPDTAFFIWAVNKFLGSECWFSTLKGRLNAPSAELAPLPDDPEIVGEGYRWEQAHPQLFTGELETEVAVLFSRSTRDYFGQIAGDYTSDYAATCLNLTRANISCSVVTAIPEFGRIRCLVMSSVVCLSPKERVGLEKFLNDGGTIIATGPSGHCDERAKTVSTTWLQGFGQSVELHDSIRLGGFPPYKNFNTPTELAQCRVPESVSAKMKEGWLAVPVGKGALFWRPERISQSEVASAVISKLSACTQANIQVDGLPANWRLRRYRDGDRLLIMALPGNVETVLHPTLKNHISNERIVQSLLFTPLTGRLTLKSSTALTRMTLHSPDLSEAREGVLSASSAMSVEGAGARRFFVLECWM